MPPRKAKNTKTDNKKKSNSSGDDQKVQKKRKQQTKDTSSSKKKRSTATSSLVVADSQQVVDHEFYFNLWGHEVNEDLMQYILDYVPVYPSLLNMRAVNRFWKNKLESVFFPKVKVLDLMTREKYEIEKFKSTKLKKMATYFPNFTTLRVCQSGWEGFFQKPNKIETLEFYDLECVAVATGFLDLLGVLVDCHKNSKHPSYLKTVNIYGTSEGANYYYFSTYNNPIGYLNGTYKKNESPMSCLETINLFYHDVDPSYLAKLTKLKAEKPISEYDHVLEFWDKMVYEENINWNLLHPFKLAELQNDDLYDVIIEYAKAQEIPVKLSDYESQLASSDLMFDEFYKKFIANSELDPCLRYKIDKDMLDRIFEKGNDHLLNQVIENKEIPLIIEGANNPLISLAQNGKLSLLKKALEREPSLLTLGNSFGKIEGDIADMNLLYLVFKSSRYRSISFHIVKALIEIGVDINYTGKDGSILYFLHSTNEDILPLFENIKLESLEKKNSNGLSTIEVWSSKYNYYSGIGFLNFFNNIYQKNGQDLKNFRTSSGGNLLHTFSHTPVTLIEYAIENLGIDISHRDNDGIPALFNVNQNVWSERLLALVKKDLDVKDVNGNTFLCNTLTNSDTLSCLLVKQGCDLEYALSNIGSIQSKFFDIKKGEPFINGAKLLLLYAFERSTNYFNILKGNLEILKKCFEIEISMSSEQFGEIRLTPVHTYLMFGIEYQTIADLGLITRKRYIQNNYTTFTYGSYSDEKEGVINGHALTTMLGNYNYGDKTGFEKESSITKLNSWQLAVKYGHYQLALKIISYIGKPFEECQQSITEIATSNLQYHIIEESLKQKLKEKKLEGDDKKLISGYIFNFTPFGDFSDLEPFIEDLIDSDVLEQKCIAESVARDTNRELKEFFGNHRSPEKSSIKFIGKMYNYIEEPMTYQLSMLEVCALKGYPLKKIQEKLSTEKELVKFLSRKEKNSGKTIMHLLCDSSLSIYLNVDKREFLSQKHSIVVSLLSKLSAASKKQVLNLLDSDHETPIFAAIRSDFKNLVKSLAPNTDMSVRNSKGKNCLDIATSEMNDILIQYADKKTLAAKREIEEEQKSRKKKK